MRSKLVVLGIGIFFMGLGFGASLADEDLNLCNRGPIGEIQTPDPQTITLTFPGPLNGYQIDLTIQNTCGLTIDQFVLDGSTATAGPIIWDSMGGFSGPATVEITGEDTQIVTSDFTGFEDSETVQYTSIDPDFLDGPSGVYIGDLVGCTVIIQAESLFGTATFEVEGSDVRAIVELGTVAADSETLGQIKAQYR